MTNLENIFALQLESIREEKLPKKYGIHSKIIYPFMRVHTITLKISIL